VSTTGASKNAGRTTPRKALWSAECKHSEGEDTDDSENSDVDEDVDEDVDDDGAAGGGKAPRRALAMRWSKKTAPKK
jgi:hypothetical protein